MQEPPPGPPPDPPPEGEPRQFLVTAGSTREKIDDVRDWGNVFTGGTGLAIAKAIAGVGEVDLLTSNRQHLADLGAAAAPRTPFPLRASGFSRHAELKAALETLLARTRYDAVFMTAAVSDYKPAGAYAVLRREPVEGEPGRELWEVADVQAGKVKSTHDPIAFLGGRTEKLVDLFRTPWGHRGLLVKFKLEVCVGPEELVRIGQESRRASGADYLVANTLDMVDGPGAGAYLLGDAGSQWIPRTELAARMAELVRPVD